MEHEDMKRVWQAIDQLDEEERLFYTRWIAGSTAGELARMFEMTEKAVGPRLKSIRQRMRHLTRGSPPDPPHP